MDNPTTLLVAIMYVTIVATGLINVLMALSDIVGRKWRADPVHAGWIVLMLLAYLSFFWETTAILEIEGWDFLSFLSFIAGPIIMLFASNLIASPGGPDDGETLDHYYFEQSARFFLLLCLVQLWIIGLDVVFDSINAMTWLTAGSALVFLALMLSKSKSFHLAGLAVVAVSFLVRVVLQAVQSGA